MRELLPPVNAPESQVAWALGSRQRATGSRECRRRGRTYRRVKDTASAPRHALQLATFAEYPTIIINHVCRVFTRQIVTDYPSSAVTPLVKGYLLADSMARTTVIHSSQCEHYKQF